jgi:hypothetical protein
MATLHRKIGAALAGTALAATALVSAVPAATAGTTDGHHSSHGTWHYKVVFDYLDCHEIEDGKGYDEVYLQWDDHDYWGYQHAYEGHRYWIKKDRHFTHDVKLSLWDHDYGPHDHEDDDLGHVWITKHDHKKGWQYAEFDDHGGDYTLKYKVVKYWK